MKSYLSKSTPRFREILSLARPFSKNSLRRKIKIHPFFKIWKVMFRLTLYLKPQPLTLSLVHAHPLFTHTESLASIHTHLLTPTRAPCHLFTPFEHAHSRYRTHLHSFTPIQIHSLTSSPTQSQSLPCLEIAILSLTAAGRRARGHLRTILNRFGVILEPS